MPVLWQKGSLLEYIFAPELSGDEDLASNLEVLSVYASMQHRSLTLI